MPPVREGVENFLLDSLSAWFNVKSAIVAGGWPLLFALFVKVSRRAESKLREIAVMKFGKSTLGAVGILGCAIVWVTSTVGDLAQGTDRIAVNEKARALLNALADETLADPVQAQDEDEVAEDLEDPGESEDTVAQDVQPLPLPSDTEAAPPSVTPDPAPVADVEAPESIVPVGEALPPVSSESIVTTPSGLPAGPAPMYSEPFTGDEFVGGVGGGGSGGSGSGLLLLGAPLSLGAGYLLDDDDDQPRQFATPAQQ